MRRKQIDHTELWTHTPVFLYFQTRDESLTCAGYADVCDHGADPTSHLDSTQAFERALAQSHCVLLKEGVYKLSHEMCNTIRLNAVHIPQAAVTNKLTL